MALKKLPYRQLRVLLTHYLSIEEDAETVALIRELRPARLRGYLTRGELEKVCHWKSPRAIRLIKSNNGARVRMATRRALATRSERRRLGCGSDTKSGALSILRLCRSVSAEGQCPPVTVYPAALKSAASSTSIWSAASNGIGFKCS
jgi:hypothetical protein